MSPLLSVNSLKVQFATRDTFATAVNDFSLTIDAGESVGLVGESGCGKTTTGLAIMRLLPGNGKIVEGNVVLDDVDLATLPEKEMRHYRGKAVALIPQDPMSSLNPTTKIGRQIGEGSAHPRRRVRRGGASPRPRGTGDGGDAAAQGTARSVPLRALGWSAPARDHRHGTGLSAQAPDRRRAHDGARRDDPSPDPGHHRSPPLRAQHGPAPHHPRHGRHRRAHRPRRRDVRRGEGRGGRDHRALLLDAPPLHPGPARVDAQHREHDEARAALDRGDAAGPHQAGRRLSVRAALRARPGPVPRR